jgi:hypothetical protein
MIILNINNKMQNNKIIKTPYNKFIKDQMTLLKNDGYNPKEIIRKATEEWIKEKIFRN